MPRFAGPCSRVRVDICTRRVLRFEPLLPNTGYARSNGPAEAPPGEGTFRLCPRRRMPREGPCGASPGRSRRQGAPAGKLGLWAHMRVFSLRSPVAAGAQRRLPCFHSTPVPVAPLSPSVHGEGCGRLDAGGPTLPPRLPSVRRMTRRRAAPARRATTAVPPAAPPCLQLVREVGMR